MLLKSSEIAKMTGFQGLARKRFRDEEQAKKYVADLGRASYFYPTKRGIAWVALFKWARYVPEMFVWLDGNPVDISWKSERLAKHQIYKDGEE